MGSYLIHEVAFPLINNYKGLYFGVMHWCDNYECFINFIFATSMKKYGQSTMVDLMKHGSCMPLLLVQK